MPQAQVLSDEQALAVRESPEVWFTAFAKLEDRAKTLRYADAPGDVQQQIFRAYQWCQMQGVPCKVVICKSRKEGASTAATALAYHHLSNYRAEAVIIGTDNSTSDNLTAMLRRFAENDQFHWGTKFSWKPSVNTGEWTHGSVVRRDTAIDPKAGRAGTIQVLVATETAHWPTNGVRSADEVMLSILNSMSDIPNSLCAVDSTANGSSGWFYETYGEAVTLADRQRGIIGNGWIKIFTAWHTSPLRAESVTEAQRGEIEATLTQRETRGQTLYGWTTEQIAWRRATIASKCGKDESKFDQEYPESELVAFQASGRPRFDLDGMTRLELAASLDKMQRVGRLDEIGNAKAMVFSYDATPEGWLWLREKPVPGGRYVAALDPMTGEQAGGKDPDTHAFHVLRTGYTDGRMVFPDEVVAVIHVEGGCRWDADQIADKAARVCRWYGNCMIIPEVNVALDVLDKLKEAGCDIYRREEPADHIRPGAKQKIIGWKTTGPTRPLIVSAVAEAVRDGTLACLYRPVIEQMRTFVVKDRRAEAMSGKHDDHVLCLGIALHNRECATTYQEAVRGWGQPASLRENEGALS